MRHWNPGIALLFLAACSTPAPPPPPPSQITVLSAQRIYTSNPQQAQVQAIAWDEKGRIVAAGDTATLAQRYPQARRIALPQATLIPGLIDAHGHVMGLGHSLLQANLIGARSKEE